MGNVTLDMVGKFNLFILLFKMNRNPWTENSCPEKLKDEFLLTWGICSNSVQFDGPTSRMTGLL